MRSTFCLFTLLLAFGAPSAEPQYDLVLRHGRVVDGTGNPWFHGDVAVRGDRIVEVGRVEGAGQREIDARGLVVAPGFIDIHSHSDWLLFEDGHAQSKIRQGVTTEILGEGSSAGPVKGKLVPPPVSIGNQPARIRTLGEYFTAVERSGISVNVASYVGQGSVWQCVMGYSFARPSPAELEQMKQLVAEAMDDGALGLSTSLLMPPGALANNEGIEYVVVNGQVVLDQGQHTGARPGRALRREAGSPVRPGMEVSLVTDAHAGEGPAWHASSRSLYFTGGNRISRLDADGAAHVFREPSGGANGLLFDHQGRLVTCEAANRRVTRTEPDGTITVLADAFEGRKFNTPNDLSMDSLGRVYFSDPRYGSRDSMVMRDGQGRLVEGVYRIDGPGQVHRIITHEVDRPNGVLVSPDDRHLYVADNNNDTVNGARKLWRFDLRPDGAIDPESRLLLFDWQTSRGPDGLKMDQAGRLYVAAGLNNPNPPFETVAPHPGGIYIFSREGRLLDFVPVPKDEVTNCAFGGEDRRTLYITAGGTLWKLGVTTAGR